MKEEVPYLNRNLSSSLMLSTHMLVLVDGIEVDSSYLAYISPSEVEFIEVLKTAGSTAIYGTRAVCGALLVTMKRGGVTLEKNTFKPGVAIVNTKGYQKVREFYSPDYNNSKNNTVLPDLRTTIYWNPQVVTDKEGKAQIDFFNADGTGNYKVIVEGINENGEIGRSVYSYQVK